MQYNLIKYLEVMTDHQTLVSQNLATLLVSSNPKPEAPRVIITNGLLVGEYDNMKRLKLQKERLSQMTAGDLDVHHYKVSSMFFNTLLNAERTFRSWAWQMVI